MAKIGTYPSASPLTGAEELIGVQSAASVKLTPEDLRTYDDSQKVTGFVGITLDAGGGGDYTTFAEVIDYLQTTEFKDAVIYVTVVAGTYSIPDSTSYRLKKEGINHLRFNGANKATTFIQIDDNEAGYYYALRFDGMDVRFSNITFTSIATTAPYAFEAYNSIVQLISCDFTGIDCLAYVYNSYFKLSSSSVTSVASTFDSLISAYQNSYIDIVSVAVDNNNGGWIVYEVSDGSTLTLTGTCSISNSDGGIDVYGRSFVYVGGTLTFTNMASYEYNVDTDIVQKDGSYVSTGNLVGPFPHQNLQTGTTYTLTYADMGAVVEMDNVSANAVTIPDNSSVAFPVDSRIEILQRGAGTTTIDTNTDTLTGGAITLDVGQSVVLWKRATTEWVPLYSLSLSSGGGLTPELKTADFTAEAGKKYYVDSSGGPVAVTLPAGTNLDNIIIHDVGHVAGTYPITITPNGAETIDSDTTAVIDQNEGSVDIMYDSANTNWEVSWDGTPQIVNVNDFATGFSATNAQTGTTYSFTEADLTKCVTANNGSASTYDIPDGLAADGETLNLYNKGAGIVTITVAGSDTLASTANTVPQGDAVTILCEGGDTWYVIGGTA